MQNKSEYSMKIIYSSFDCLDLYVSRRSIKPIILKRSFNFVTVLLHSKTPENTLKRKKPNRTLKGVRRFRTLRIQGSRYGQRTVTQQKRYLNCKNKVFKWVFCKNVNFKYYNLRNYQMTWVTRIIII